MMRPAQKRGLLAGRADWLEPLENWMKTSQNAGEIAVSDDLSGKKVLAQQVLGSNLVLDGKKARGCCIKPWSFLLEPVTCGKVVVGTGFEPV